MQLIAAAPLFLPLPLRPSCPGQAPKESQRLTFLFGRKTTKTKDFHILKHLGQKNKKQRTL